MADARKLKQAYTEGCLWHTRHCNAGSGCSIAGYDCKSQARVEKRIGEAFAFKRGIRKGAKVKSLVLDLWKLHQNHGRDWASH